LNTEPLRDDKEQTQWKIEPAIGSSDHLVSMYAKQFGDLILWESIIQLKDHMDLESDESFSEIFGNSDDDSDESEE